MEMNIEGTGGNFAAGSSVELIIVRDKRIELNWNLAEVSNDICRSAIGSKRRDIGEPRIKKHLPSEPATKSIAPSLMLP